MFSEAKAKTTAKVKAFGKVDNADKKLKIHL